MNRIVLPNCLSISRANAVWSVLERQVGTSPSSTSNRSTVFTVLSGQGFLGLLADRGRGRGLAATGAAFAAATQFRLQVAEFVAGLVQGGRQPLQLPVQQVVVVRDHDRAFLAEDVTRACDRRAHLLQPLARQRLVAAGRHVQQVRVVAGHQRTDEVEVGRVQRLRTPPPLLPLSKISVMCSQSRASSR